jgi:multimeric flavodoxin WrbA
MKQVMVLLGSPRARSNSSLIAARLCARAEELGAQTRTFPLNRMSYRGCQACDGCRQGEATPCVLEDDLTTVLEDVHRADVLVLATPVYFGDVSAQMKGFIDRTRSFIKPDFRTNPEPSRLPPGKRLVFIQTQAEEEESTHDDIFPRYDFFFRWFGFHDSLLIRACGVNDRGEIKTRPEVLDQATRAAEKILSA